MALRKLFLSKYALFLASHSDIQLNLASTSGHTQLSASSYSIDVCHEFTEKRFVATNDAQMFVMVGDRPWWAQRRHHILTALLGINWMVRDLLDARSTYA